MKNLLIIALRNLFRYKRRTILTSSLIAFGVVLVIVFGGLAISFKTQMIGIVTNTALGDLQIHKRGYVESIDNLPLNITLSAADREAVEQRLKSNPSVEAYSPRMKFGAMISNYAQTSNIRLSAVYPEMESRTCPDLVKRIKTDIADPAQFVKPGEILVPENLMKGLSLEVGNDVVILGTNKDGSVNGMTLRIAAMMENVFGPSGKDGYIHMDDAVSLLRMDAPEIVEIAIHLRSFDKLQQTATQLREGLGGKTSPVEVHTWEQLSPFSSIARIVDLLIMVVKVILISIVLVSVLNIMTMSVYERIAEIGTIAAIGTPPGRILVLFLLEGLFLGVLSAAIGTAVGVAIVWLLNSTEINFVFGQMDVALAPTIPGGEILWTIGIVIAVSILAGLQPAYKASRMEPVVALGHV
jgi:putative ABC transport system permease protein